jgi:hypothetical protein
MLSRSEEELLLVVHFDFFVLFLGFFQFCLPLYQRLAAFYPLPNTKIANKQRYKRHKANLLMLQTCGNCANAWRSHTLIQGNRVYI